MIDEYISDLVQSFNKKQDKLTKEQFQDCLMEAISSGDFLLECTQLEVSTNTYDTYNIIISKKQKMTYRPYREVNKLKKENEKLKDIIKYAHKMCLCERFKTKGFDYHEQHPMKDTNNGASRPYTPRDYIENICGYSCEDGKYPKIITFNNIRD